MRWQDLDLLEEIGLTLYERKALATLMVQGIADAEALCREGEVPSSKIHQAMEKLAGLGLAEIQPTRPKLYSALTGDEIVNRLIDISRNNSEQFSKRAEKLRSNLAAHRERVRGRKAFVDLALGVESHVKRHMTHLTTARKRIWSYLEHGDLAARASRFFGESLETQPSTELTIVWFSALPTRRRLNWWAFFASTGRTWNT